MGLNSDDGLPTTYTTRRRTDWYVLQVKLQNKARVIL